MLRTYSSDMRTHTFLNYMHMYTFNRFGFHKKNNLPIGVYCISILVLSYMYFNIETKIKA